MASSKKSVLTKQEESISIKELEGKSDKK